MGRPVRRAWIDRRMFFNGLLVVAHREPRASVVAGAWYLLIYQMCT